MLQMCAIEVKNRVSNKIEYRRYESGSLPQPDFSTFSSSSPVCAIPSSSLFSDSGVISVDASAVEGKAGVEDNSGVNFVGTGRLSSEEEA